MTLSRHRAWLGFVPAGGFWCGLAAAVRLAAQMGGYPASNRNPPTLLPT